MSEASPANTSKSAEAGGWSELRLGGPLPALEAFAEFVAERGAGGSIFSEDPARPGGQMVTAFIPAVAATPALLDQVANLVAWLREEYGPSVSRLELARVEDRDWAQEWRDRLEPIRLEPGLWIVPTHRELPRQAAGEPVIFMDPGLAFGTGGHETTRMCVAQVARAVQAGARQVLDLGTGAGILAMAAARFGATSITAIDIDPVALRVARENLELNHLADLVTLGPGVTDPDAALPGESYDLVVANLFAEALARLMPLIKRVLRPAGTAILSGVLSSRRDLILAAAKSNGLIVTESIEEQEWVTLLLKPCASAG